MCGSAFVHSVIITDHAQALANLALDILAYYEKTPLHAGKSIKFRIGINSGALVAGVIGQKKFHFDVWGDTVNTASRMESHGMPGKMETWFLVGLKQ